MNTTTLLYTWLGILEKVRDGNVGDALPSLLKHCQTAYQCEHEAHVLRHFEYHSNYLRRLSKQEVEEAIQRINQTLGGLNCPAKEAI